MSVIDPIACGFVKILCCELFSLAKKIPITAYGNPKHSQCEILKPQYESLTDTFPFGSHGIEKYHQFTNNFKNIFLENWEKLGKGQKIHYLRVS